MYSIGVEQVWTSKWQPLGQFMPMHSPQYLYHLCPYLCSEPQVPPTSPEDPPIPAGRSVPGPYEVTAFPPCPSAHKTLNAPSKSVFKHSKSGVSVIRSHWPSKTYALGVPPLMQDNRTEESDMGLRALILLGEPL